MNTLTRIIATALTTVVACVGVTLVGAPSQAAPSSSRSTASVGDRLCYSQGVTNYYVHHWQDIDPMVILNSPYVFRESRCNVQGFRLYKSTSNTPGEVRFARHFLKFSRPKQPAIFCWTSPGHAYFLDLAAFWTSEIPHLNAHEREHFAGWAHKYADRHGCQLFVPKAGAR